MNITIQHAYLLACCSPRHPIVEEEALAHLMIQRWGPISDVHRRLNRSNQNP